MNTTPSLSTESWLSLIGSPVTVLGPSRGHVPDLSKYRIAQIHLCGETLWLYGAVTGLPDEAERNGERDGITKFNLAIQLSLRELISLSGYPDLDGEHDDSMHGFELALPVDMCVARTDELVWPDAEHRIFDVIASSSHLKFRARAMFITAYGGKHARKRYTNALHVRT